MDEFEWDEAKAEANLDKHGIDFKDAVTVFEGPVLETSSVRRGERRSKVIGRLRDDIVVVVYTVRSERRRIISARKASKDEREAYRQILPEGS
jgi:uncharacterized protein